MGLTYSNRAGAVAAGTLCCDNRRHTRHNEHATAHCSSQCSCSTSTYVHTPTNADTHTAHGPLIPSRPPCIICTQHYNHKYMHHVKRANTHTHTMRQHSLLQHMLGCSEVTLTARLTSVCYEHGPVSTPASFFLAISSLCLFHRSVLPPSLSFILMYR